MPLGHEDASAPRMPRPKAAASPRRRMRITRGTVVVREDPSSSRDADGCLYESPGASASSGDIVGHGARRPMVVARTPAHRETVGQVDDLGDDAFARVVLAVLA